MPTVAEQLRHAREEQNLSVHEIAEVTKIKTDHIRALEESNYNAFAAPIYLRGFVRTYARVLKLNVPRVLQDLDAELAELEHFQEPASLTGQPTGFLDTTMLQLSKVNWRVVLPLLLVVVLLIVTVWAFRRYKTFQANDPLKSLGSGMYEPRQTNFSGEILPLPSSSASKSP